MRKKIFALTTVPRFINCLLLLSCLSLNACGIYGSLTQPTVPEPLPQPNSAPPIPNNKPLSKVNA